MKLVKVSEVKSGSGRLQLCAIESGNYTAIFNLVRQSHRCFKTCF